jgi:predicted membrane channel-forming protein YqfA (hemolysin III family)
VWTHFSGFVIFLVLAGMVMLQLDWRSPSEAFLFLAFFFTVECSMLSSTIFHAFNCHSPCTYVRTRSLPHARTHARTLSSSCSGI